MSLLDEHSEFADTFARHATTMESRDLPDHAVEVTKRSILDTLGVMLGATGITPGVSDLVGLAKEGGGREESTILVFGGKVPVWMAAFANGAMAHCLDYDDVHDEAGLHASTSTIPAGFAMAERLGNVCGKDLIAAIAVGNDLACRLGLAIKWRADWHISPLFGAFSATAVAARLLRLDHKRMVDALGIALCQAAGTMELAYGAGSDLRGMYAAFPAQTGVLSALMAANNIAAGKRPFEGKAGLFAAHFGGEYNRAALIDSLGQTYHGSDMSFKPWPTCRLTHCFIEAVLSLMAIHRISADQIDAIHTCEGRLAHTCAEPLDLRRRPQSTLDAKYSIPFCVAVAAVKGAVKIADFTPSGIRAPEVLAMAQKVTPMLEEELDCLGVDSCGAVTPGRVIVFTKQGDVYQRTVQFAYGHPRNPISKQDLVAKFVDCAAYAARPLHGKHLLGVVDMVDRLELVEDVAAIVTLLA